MTDRITPSLLHIDCSASPLPDSVSRRLTALFADTWRAQHGSAGYRYRDLAADPVPLVGPGYVSHGTRVEREGATPPSGAGERGEWALTEPLLDEVHAADTVLLGVPMYNFAVPAALKAWIDRISFPGALDRALDATRVVLVAVRGGGYGPGTPREGCDYQEPYLRTYFAAHGVTDLHVVLAELTRAADIPALAGLAPLAAESLRDAQAAITALARAVPVG